MDPYYLLLIIPHKLLAFILQPGVYICSPVYFVETYSEPCQTSEIKCLENEGADKNFSG